MGVFRKVANLGALVTLFEAVGYCWFWWCFNRKLWSVDAIIIVIYINGVCHRGSYEMSQIHTQWWHFSRLLVTMDFDGSFNTKVWSVDHIIIALRRHSERCTCRSPRWRPWSQPCPPGAARRGFRGVWGPTGWSRPQQRSKGCFLSEKPGGHAMGEFETKLIATKITWYQSSPPSAVSSATWARRSSCQKVLIAPTPPCQHYSWLIYPKQIFILVTSRLLVFNNIL